MIYAVKTSPQTSKSAFIRMAFSTEDRKVYWPWHHVAAGWGSRKLKNTKCNKTTDPSKKFRTISITILWTRGTPLVTNSPSLIVTRILTQCQIMSKRTTFEFKFRCLPYDEFQKTRSLLPCDCDRNPASNF